MTQDPTFERLRRQIADDLSAVTPIRPGWQSALVFLPAGLILLGLLILSSGLRNDAEIIGAGPLWVPTILGVGAAYGILTLALVQRAPESATSWLWWTLYPLGALGLQVGGAYWTLQHDGGLVATSWQTEAMCPLAILLLGAAPLALTLWLLSRGFPLRPKVAGLLAGLAGGMLSEALYRLHCAISQLRHVLPWHTGAILVMGLIGILAGVWWERRRARGVVER